MFILDLFAHNFSFVKRPNFSYHSFSSTQSYFILGIDTTEIKFKPCFLRVRMQNMMANATLETANWEECRTFNAQ